MPYGQSRLRAQYYAGDPFLGGLVKGIGKVLGGVAKVAAPVLGGVVGGVPGAILGGILRRGVPGVARRVPPAPQVPGLPPLYAYRGPPRPGAPPRAVTVDPVTGEVKARRRRMNYANQRALRRSLRRVTGYARQQKSVRKAAQEFAREFAPKRRAPRRDLPRGHIHVR